VTRPFPFLLICLLLLSFIGCDEQPANTPTVPATSELPAVSGDAPQPSENPGRQAKGEPGVPAPSPTPHAPADSATDDVSWTILVYVRQNGDNTAGLLARLDQMEAAAPSEGIQIALQLDGVPPAPGDDPGAGTYRYLLARDPAPGVIGSPVVASLGEVDSGDPQTLAAFVTWALETYPAQKTALWLWDTPSASGLQAPSSSPSESLGVPDLAAAVGTALEDHRPLDLIALDTNLPADLALLATLQPTARVAMSASGLFGGGLDYQSLLAAIDADPPADGAALGAAMHQHIRPGAHGPFATANVVDLQAIPTLLSALDAVSTALLAEPAVATSVVAAAHAGSQLLAAPDPLADRPQTAVDLGTFALLLADLSPDLTTKAAAARLHDAAQAALLPISGAEVTAPNAITVPFSPPPSADEALSLNPLPASWLEFQHTYYQHSLPEIPIPTLTMLQVAGAGAGVLQPAFVGFELSGYGIGAVYAKAWRLEDEDARLVAVDQILPQPHQSPGGHDLSHWRDGVHEDNTIWDTRAPYLSDGESGEFVALWPLAPGSDLAIIPGQLQSSASPPAADAFLLYERSTGGLLGAWRQSEGLLPHPLVPQPDDAFTPYIYRRTSAANLTATPGAAIRYGATGPTYSLQPLPVGNYQLGFEALTIGGQTTDVYAELAVNNDGDDGQTRAYLDPADGFQFHFPAAWQTPHDTSGAITSASPDGATTLTITRYSAEGRRTRDVKTQALEAFGPVSLVFADTRPVAGSAAELVAYSYDAPDGPRTGVFLALTHEGRGYVVDVDGPASAEAQTLAILEQIAATWLWRPLGVERVEGIWRTLELPSFTVPVPEGYNHHKLDNGWDLFSHEGRFVAVRRDPATGQSRAARVQHWLDVANEGVGAFEQSAPYSFGLAGRSWVRADFSYERNDRAVRGLVMVAVGAGVESATWAEAPADQYEALVDGVLLALAAEALGPTTAEQQLYHASFDTAGTWGLGSDEGATAEVADGVHRLSVSAGNGFYWTAAGQSFGDAIYEVTATQHDGPLDNGYGLLFRAGPDAASFYVFEVSGDGYVWIGRCEAACATLTTLVGDGWFRHPAVRTGLGAANKLHVVAGGPEMRFFVNDVLVGEVNDGTLAHGDVGLFVETLGEGDVVVTFDDVTVYAR
jgi:hypothetical protein